MKTPAQQILLFRDAVADQMPNGKFGGLTLDWQSADDPQPFTILDFFDRSICKSGRLLIETGGTLLLLSARGPRLSQGAGRSGNFVSDLAAGSVRDALGGFSRLRSLIPICSGRLEEQCATLMDDERKTRARARFLTLRAGTARVTLADLQAIRGYAKAYEILADHVGGLGNPASGVRDIYSILAPETGHHGLKPEIDLGEDRDAYEVATDIIAAHLALARRHEAGVIADHDTEFLHDYRVALRKTRSVVSLFKGVYSEDETQHLKSRLSALMAPTGPLRDLDVYLLDRQDFHDLLPQSLQDGLSVMFGTLERERAAYHKRLSRYFKSAAYRTSIEALTGRFSGRRDLSPGPNAGAPAGRYARSLIWKRYRKVCRIASAIGPETPDAHVHDLRIHCKKLRYLMEFFAPLFPEKTFRALLKPLKKLQDNLGLFNDYAVQQTYLQNFMDTHAGKTRKSLAEARSIGALIALLHQKQRAERARVIETFAHFDSPGVQRRFRKLFRNGEH